MFSNDKFIEKNAPKIYGFKSLILFMALFFLVSTMNLGQIKDCSETHTAGVYHVYLDELYYTAEAIKSGEDLQNLMGRLVFRLGSVMEGIMQEVGVTALCAISYCQGRKPRGMADFNSALVNKLHMEDVILEVWGSLDTKKNESNELYHEARIYYLLVPVWIDAYNNKIQPGYQFEMYTSGSATNTDKPLDLLQDAPEMRIFVKICIGKNLLLNKKYDDARKLLCAARLQLEHYIKSKSYDKLSEREKALIIYVDQIARQTVTMAKANPNYKGALTLIEDDAECPCLKGGVE